MARVKEITVSFGFTKGLPGFSSVRIDESVTLELDETDDVEKVKTEEYAKLKASVKTKLQEL
jgi:hypothetical protein